MLKDLTETDVNSARHLDDDLLLFMKQMNTYLENTIVILMSDHGVLPKKVNPTRYFIFSILRLKITKFKLSNFVKTHISPSGFNMYLIFRFDIENLNIGVILDIIIARCKKILQRHDAS